MNSVTQANRPVHFMVRAAQQVVDGMPFDDVMQRLARECCLMNRTKFDAYAAELKQQVMKIYEAK